MRRLAWRMLMKNAAVSTGLARKLYPPPPPPPLSPGDERVMPWVEARGDRTLRVDYDLDESSLVWDVGGYEGDWAAEIFARYRCHVEIFEPVKDFARSVGERFAKNPFVAIHAFGLAGRTRTETITLEQNSSSIFRPGERLEQITLVDVASHMRQLGVPAIELMKINIEGGEYELLERLIETGDVENVRNLQVQFHDFVPNAERRMNAIHEALVKTHRCTYRFPWVWEGWARHK